MFFPWADRIGGWKAKYGTSVTPYRETRGAPWCPPWGSARCWQLTWLLHWVSSLPGGEVGRPDLEGHRASDGAVQSLWRLAQEHLLIHCEWFGHIKCLRHHVLNMFPVRPTSLRRSLDWFSFWGLCMWTRTVPRWASPCLSVKIDHIKLVALATDLYSALWSNLPKLQHYITSHLSSCLTSPIGSVVFVII